MRRCHGADYSGSNFGAAIPIVAGLWASNISRTIPEMSDAELERLLREGIHPDREIYVMPSKQTQFLSERDMAALIAFLRTIPPVGEATPLPPAGFEAAVTARLPDDYHNAAEEVAYFAEHQPPDLGPQSARGRIIATTLCSTCHGAALDGLGEPAGNIQGALAPAMSDGIHRRCRVVELSGLQRGPRLKMATIPSSQPSQPKTRGLRARSDAGMGSWRLGTTKMVAFELPIAAFPD